MVSSYLRHHCKHRVSRTKLYQKINSMKITKYSTTIWLYALWLVIVIMRISLGTFDLVGFRLIFILVILVIKDILLYMVDFKATEVRTYDFARLKHEKKSRFYYYLLRNRVYIFPILLTIYLLYLLVKQTQLWNLNNSIFYHILNENVLLTLVIISWIFTVFKEEKDKTYQIIKHSMTNTYLHIWLSVVLSLLAVYIVYIQVASLGRISYPISGISGILIFLIGVMIIQDDDKEESEE